MSANESYEATREIQARLPAARPGYLVGLREGAWPDGLFGHGGSDGYPVQAATVIGAGISTDEARLLADPAWATGPSALLQSNAPSLSGPSQAAGSSLVEVDVYCEGVQASGWVDVGQFARLSDWLNMQSGFIAIRRDSPAAAAHASAEDARETREAGGVRWVRLSSVVLIGEREVASSERGWHATPVVEKERVPVSMVTPGYRLDGYLHVHSDGSLLEYLSLPEPRFLAVTDVSIRSRSDADRVARFRFALVSREHLVLVCDES
jgi:hypothetical protein